MEQSTWLQRRQRDWQPLQPVAKPGDVRFIDQNGDGMLDSNDKIKMGSGTPKIALAFNINLEYKNFDLVANFYGHFGVKRYNYTKYQLQRMDQVFNSGKDALRAWTPTNTNTDVPRAVQGDPNKNGRPFRPFHREWRILASEQPAARLQRTCIILQETRPRKLARLHRRYTSPYIHQV